MSDIFWLSERRLSRLAPHLPTDTRGKPRVDDRRVISGIVHVLKSDGRWVDALRSMGRAKRSTIVSCAGRRRAYGRTFSMPWPRRRPAGEGADRFLCGEGASLCRRGKGGERTQAIGRSRGGRTTKILALTNGFCRPLGFLLTGGQVADCTAADALLDQLPPTELLHGDKGYDTDAVRRKTEASGAAPNIPPKINRRWKPCFSPVLYRGRNAIERMFGCLKDFRRIATKYDRLAANFLAAVHIAATVSYSLSV